MTGREHVTNTINLFFDNNTGSLTVTIKKNDSLKIVHTV